MTAPAEDRLLLLLAQNELTGIDFVYVHNSQTRLDVFFLLAPETLNSPLPGSLAEDTIRIENIRDEGEPDVPITHLEWAVVDGRTVLRLDVARPASFADYRLTIDDPRIDPYFQNKIFNSGNLRNRDGLPAR